MPSCFRSQRRPSRNRSGASSAWGGGGGGHSWSNDQTPAETRVHLLKVLKKALQKSEKTAEADALAPRLAGIEALADQENLERTRKVVSALTDKAAGEVQWLAFRELRTALQKTGKSDELKALEVRFARLDTLLDKEYLAKMPPFKSDPFSGRKSKSNRVVVVVELFTGAQCQPCIAADLGFDGLEMSYKPSDVILLQYHLHIPSPDPLANADTKAALRFPTKRTARRRRSSMARKMSVAAARPLVLKPNTRNTAN